MHLISTRDQGSDHVRESVPLLWRYSSDFVERQDGRRRSVTSYFSERGLSLKNTQFRSLIPFNPGRDGKKNPKKIDLYKTQTRLAKEYGPITQATLAFGAKMVFIDGTRFHTELMKHTALRVRRVDIRSLRVIFLFSFSFLQSRIRSESNFPNFRTFEYFSLTIFLRSSHVLHRFLHSFLVDDDGTFSSLEIHKIHPSCPKNRNEIPVSLRILY